MIKKLYIWVPAILLLVLQSCSYTRNIPEGKLLLTYNEIKVDRSGKVPKVDENIIKQQPNTGIWFPARNEWGTFISPSLGIYNWGSGEDSKVWSKIGEAPVLLDTNKVIRSSDQLRTWYFNQGYFNATSSYRIDSLRRQKPWAGVKYYIKPGKRYYISGIAYNLNNSVQQKLMERTASESLIDPGEPYIADVLNDERARLTALFRNNGFYNFNREYITFEADTFQAGDSVKLKMNISDIPVETGDSVKYLPHQVHYLNKVYIRTIEEDENLSDTPDTIHFRNYSILYNRLRYKPRFLTDAIHFRPGEVYNYKTVKESYAHLVSYNNFRMSEIKFVRAGGDSLGPALDAYIYLRPMKKRTFTFEPELTNTSGNWGVRSGIGWINRNLFKGGEILDIHLNAGLEYQPTASNSGFSQTFEIGSEIGIRFPRFLLPFNSVGLIPKRMQPYSRLSLSYNKLLRAEFKRETFNAGLSYIWRPNVRLSQQVYLFDIAYSKLYDRQQEFLNNLTDIQQAAFTSEFISAFRYSLTYNEQLDPEVKNPKFFLGSIETAGNGFHMLDKNTGLAEESPGEPNKYLGVQYYQFVRLEVDGRHYWNMSPRHSWVNRAYSGYILPYGNSTTEIDGKKVRIPPFSRYFYMGGNNDLRAWPAYRLGAGRQNNTDYSAGRDTSFATGTFKLLLNSEYRFPLISSLYGAVFIDAGNIWYTGGLENAQTKLDLKSLVTEMALGTGMGLRLDVDFFVIRFDVGMKLRDPGLLDENKEWVMWQQPKLLNNLSYHVALGYPF